MGRELKYRPGSFYRVDDRTGFPTRAERTRKQWDGLMVSERVWEARQPQDFVRGVRDDQTVPEARPLTALSFVGPAWTTLAQMARPQTHTLILSSLVGVDVGDTLSVMLDTGEAFRSTVAQVGRGELQFVGSGAIGFTGAGGASLTFYGDDAQALLLSSPLPQSASAGNEVTNFGNLGG